jgi:ketosteroid isomerase-like protein
MGQPTEKIAEMLRSAASESPEAYTEALAGLWADQIGTEHEPPRDMDGPRTRDQQVAMHRGEDAAFRRALPDFRQDDVTVSVAGDRIELGAIITGTATSGEVVAVPVRWRFTVDNGALTHVVTVVDPAHTAPVVKILNAAGIATPD